jgi:hypothetical protein
LVSQQISNGPGEPQRHVILFVDNFTVALIVLKHTSFTLLPHPQPLLPQGAQQDIV